MLRANSPRESLAIVGGTYNERCESPCWNELYGSGFRAAAALANRGARISLHTCTDDNTAASLSSIAASLQIALEATPVSRTPAFTYLHPLDDPIIFHGHDASANLASVTPLKVSAPNVLRYGMLEATAIVHGEKVVYDPQAPLRPESFAANGSTAERLAVVANRREATHLTGIGDINEAGTWLQRHGGAEVVVIKNGPHGAAVFDSDGIHRVPAFRTRRTFPIGSGDIFSAVFAFEWMVKGAKPSDAAGTASLATAWYCQSPGLPLPAQVPSDFHLGAHFPSSDGMKRRAYLAGPFFNLMQLWFVREVRACLHVQGLDVFSPYHDVGIGDDMTAIAEADLQGLDDCDLVFALLDGYDPGTIFEIGHARARGKPVIILLSNPEPTHLTMFEGTGCHVFNDLTSAVYAAAWIED